DSHQGRASPALSPADAAPAAICMCPTFIAARSLAVHRHLSMRASVGLHAVNHAPLSAGATMDAVAAPRAPQARIRVAPRVTPLRLAVALTVLALALRLIDLGGRPLWLDEAFSAWFSDRSFHYLWTVVPTYEAHPPFHYSVLKLWRSILGEGTIALRSFSV